MYRQSRGLNLVAAPSLPPAACDVFFDLTLVVDGPSAVVHPDVEQSLLLVLAVLIDNRHLGVDRMAARLDVHPAQLVAADAMYVADLYDRHAPSDSR